MTEVQQDPHPTWGRFLLYLWRLSRPEIWMVTILPVLVGHVLASKELVPGLDLWVAFWSRATSTGATFDEFRDTLASWLIDSGDFLLALVVMGPLVWAATLLINDVHDLAGDRLNPRKAASPLVQGSVTRRTAHLAAYAFAGLAVIVGSLVNPTFAILTFVALALAWLYSAPPMRLKTRPGADLAINALGVGVGAGLAGWSIAAPVGAFPWTFLPQGVFVAVAVYAPTTTVDHASDRAAGYHTLATHLGPRNAYRIGWYAWILANVGSLVLAWNGWLLPHRFFPVLLVFVPLLLYQYHRLIGRARTPEAMVEGILTTSLTFFAVNLIFALMYTGLWV